MHPVLTFQLLFLSIFAVANNLKSLGKFLEITEGLSRKEELKICWIATLASLAIMLVALFCGEAVLRFFGISLNSFRIAGGIVLVIMSVGMVLGQKINGDGEHPKTNKYSMVISSAIIPIAMPLTTGAGTFSTIIILVDEIRGNWNLYYQLLGAVLLQTAIIYLVFHYSRFLLKILGHVGMEVLIRFVGLITLTLGIQFITIGLRSVFPGWL
ncbi:MAG: antibiotic resistance protein MarC [Burkholderiales bacterium]|jgi:multiple antibiotic resistance protein|nr:antibiotic resistance protein MarC [Burkholderiales bacterium]